jgi:CHAT domain-containing protein
LELPERFNYLLAAGQVSLGAKQYAEGIRYFEQAIAEGTSVGAFRETAVAQSALSEVYLSTGDLPKAEELARNAVSTLERGSVLPLLPPMLDSLAQVLIAQQKYQEADATYDHAATLQDALIGRADSFITKTALITGADQLYSHHFALIADHFKNPEKGYEVVEQGRSRPIVDLLLSGGSTSSESISAERAIARLRLKLTTLKSKSEIDKVRQAVFLAEQSRAINPDLTIFSTRQFKPIPLATIQQTLGASETLLEYVVAEPSSYVLVVTSTSKRIIKLAGRKTIEKLVEDYRRAVTSQTSSTKQARDLFGVLLRPIPQVTAKTRLIVVPDGSLNLLPFDALIDEHGRYVVQSHVITYAPSSTTLYLLKSKPFVGKRANALLAVGGVPYSQGGIKLTAVERGPTPDKEFGDLPNSEAEVKAAETAIRSPENKEITGANATETNLKQALVRQFGYVHLAVHAFSSANPDRASLVVLRDPSHGEDGFIQASEIVQMRIPAKLVVLSACETQVGPIQGEEGVSALSTAFLLAGARTVVSTLWPIDDQAALLLMQAFYRHLGRGEPPADSMATAKRELLAKYGSKSSPVYWAGFVVQGSDTVQTPSRNEPQVTN